MGAEVGFVACTNGAHARASKKNETIFHHNFLPRMINCNRKNAFPKAPLNRLKAGKNGVFWCKEADIATFLLFFEGEN